MSKVLLDVDVLGQIQLFQKVTRARVKDCVAGEPLLFVVEEGDIGKAIGKKGGTLKKVERLLKKPLKVVGFSSDVCTFVQQYLRPLQVTDITYDSGVVKISGLDGRSKGKIIGREKKNLQALVRLLRRYFPVESVEVL